MIPDRPGVMFVGVDGWVGRKRTRHAGRGIQRAADSALIPADHDPILVNGNRVGGVKIVAFDDSTGVNLSRTEPDRH